MLVNREGKAFVGMRIDNKDSGFWQMPQGGVDDGENLQAAALRELGEETGLQPEHVEIVAQLDEELYYDLPPELQGKLWKGKYRGQRQYWVLARLTGEDSDIDLEADDHPEFCDWKWVEPEELPGMIVPFKRAIYEAVVAGFRDLI